MDAFEDVAIFMHRAAVESAYSRKSDFPCLENGDSIFVSHRKVKISKNASYVAKVCYLAGVPA